MNKTFLLVKFEKGMKIKYFISKNKKLLLTDNKIIDGKKSIIKLTFTW